MILEGDKRSPLEVAPAAKRTEAFSFQLCTEASKLMTVPTQFTVWKISKLAGEVPNARNNSSQKIIRNCTEITTKVAESTSVLCRT